MPKILIVEDDLIIGEHLKLSIQKMGHEPIGPVPTAEEAVHKLETHDPDLLLIDIRLKGTTDGIGLANYIKLNFPGKGFIFLTSFTDKSTINKAVDADPLGYLVKPFNQSDLFTTIELGLHSVKKREKKEKLPTQNSNNIYLSKNNEVIKVPVTDIVWIETFQGILKVHTSEDVFRVQGTFEEITKKLPQVNFEKISHKDFVNIDSVDSFSNEGVRIGTRMINIDEKYKSNLIKRLNFLNEPATTVENHREEFSEIKSFTNGNYSCEITEREQEIIEGIAEGLSYKLVADKLSISIETVRHHIKKIYKKLNINSKGELISKYLSGQV